MEMLPPLSKRIFLETVAVFIGACLIFSPPYGWCIEATDGNGIRDELSCPLTPMNPHEFVIIASSEWYDYEGPWDLARLRDWHNHNDTLRTYIVNLSDILSNPSFWVNGLWGDGNPDNPYKRTDEDAITNYAMFNDSAAKVRNYIRYAHSILGVRYALLVGDADDFPYRQLYAHAYGAPAGLDDVIDNVPADLYFGCLDGTFNDDEDTYATGQHRGWGENETYNANGIDEVDWEYEVAIGRFCPDTPAELSNCIRKTIAYMELNGDEPYLYNFTGAGHAAGWGGQAEWAVNYSKELNGTTCESWGHTTYGFNPDLYTFTWINPDPNRPPGDIDYTDTNVKDTFNAGTHVFVQGGHGGANQFSNYLGYGDSWSLSDVRTLTNTDYFLILASTNCQCGRFDADDCLSEVFVNDDYGAFASIMNSRAGWGSDDTPEYQQGLNSTGHYAVREFFDAYFNPSEGYTRIGDLLFDAKRDCAWLRDEGEATVRFTNFEKCLIGSPAVPLKFPQGNQRPKLSNPAPPDGAVDVSISTGQLSIHIADLEGDNLNWSIETRPNVGSNGSDNDTSGTKTCSMSGLQNWITYRWYVNATDRGSGNWTNKTYTFTTSGEPAIDPSSSFVTLTNNAYPGLTTCPLGDGSVYQYVQITVRNVLGQPVEGILANNFEFIVTPIGDTQWNGTLSCTFTPVDPKTNVDGAIRFNVTGDTTISGNITIAVTVNEVPLNDSDALPCKSFDLIVDGWVNLIDFAQFAGDYNAPVYRSDFNWNGEVNLIDFMMFAQHYLHHR